ncbi:amidohydrolase family protein [Candidatus Woesearchaeota archaeon]|nr:amidohydrolase family protein [Candidatus Woesearchaeota archaeon]
MSLLLKNCKLLAQGLPVIKNIYIENGIIKGIGSLNISADKIIDVKEHFVIPGLIDSHVHFREPGLNHKEDWKTGSHAAAKGGVTTVLDMPNTKPPTFTLSDLNKKRELACKSVVNYGFHLGASAEDNSEDILDVRDIASTKVYMNNTTGNLLIEDLKLIKKIFMASKMISTHAEEKQVEEAVEIAKKTGKRLYLCHLSLKSEVDFLKQNKTSNIFCEVTPHHLFLTDADFKKKKGFAKMLPTLKTKKDQKALWDAIDEGVIDTIGTDHAPHTIDEKKAKKYPAGVPGVETMLPLMLDAVNRKRITLQKLVEMTSRNPAKIFGIKNKGLLKVGYDADLVIVDMNMKKKVKNEELLTKCRWSPFNNKILKGWPIITIVNGNIVFDNQVYDIKAKEICFGGA